VLFPKTQQQKTFIMAVPMGSYFGKACLAVKISSWTRIAGSIIPPMAKVNGGYVNSYLAAKEARSLACELLAMDEEPFREAFARSPMKRAKLRGLKRNAAVVLGNIGTPDDRPVLERAIEDEEPLVREHAVWALDQIASRQSVGEAHRT